jgi:hypothetical protein
MVDAGGNRSARSASEGRPEGPYGDASQGEVAFHLARPALGLRDGSRTHPPCHRATKERTATMLVAPRPTHSNRRRQAHLRRIALRTSIWRRSLGRTGGTSAPEPGEA